MNTLNQREPVRNEDMNRKARWLRRYLIVFGLLNISVVSFTIPLFLVICCSGNHATSPSR